MYNPMVDEFFRSDPPGEGGRGWLRARQRGGAKMNFTILTSTKVWGIKSRVINSVDSESGRIFMIGPPRGRLGARGGAKLNFPILS